jgi:hypothetical protein
MDWQEVPTVRLPISKVLSVVIELHTTKITCTADSYDGPKFTPGSGAHKFLVQDGVDFPAHLENPEQIDMSVHR